MTCYYNKQGKEITLKEFGELTFEDRIVGQDSVKDYRISTVLLSIDHNWSSQGDPIIFETMIFESGSYNDLFCERYCTLEQAEQGHKDTVEKVKNGELP